jgi:diguanylate cyclase (GGDEF)-like protein/PAS domain S-box-containing protein
LNHTIDVSLVDENLFFKDLVSLCPDGIIAVNRKGIIITFNQAAEDITGYTCEETINRMSISDVYNSVNTARKIKKDMYGKDYGGPGRLQNYETEVFHKSGKKTPIRLSATLLYDKDKEVGNVGFFHDLTSHKQMEERLHELSITDDLTGLFNHRHLFKILAEEKERAHRYKRPLSLICMDLDNFKQCNDTYGHIEGDRILRSMGDTLHSILRQSDYGFRFGGDEFMILLPETNINEAATVAQKTRDIFGSRLSCLDPRKRPKGITLSIGIAQASKVEEPESFIKRADLAMYEAKKDGGDQIRTARSSIGKKMNEEI